MSQTRHWYEEDPVKEISVNRTKSQLILKVEITGKVFNGFADRDEMSNFSSINCLAILAKLKIPHP